MSTDLSTILSTVPISQFNRGLAGRIFEDVRKNGAKVVMKDNVAECVLMSPDEYVRLMDELDDARLMLLAAERMKNHDSADIIPETDVLDMLGITEEDLDNAGEVEFD